MDVDQSAQISILMEVDMASVGTILKTLRLAKNISQGDMAHQLGVSQNFLSLVENNKKTVSLTTLASFAMRLGISKEFILLAASDIPPELTEKQKQNFSKMQQAMLEYLTII